MKVVAAESEVVCLQFPAHLLGQLLDHRSAFRPAFLEKPLQALLRVGALTEILRHVILLRGLPPGNVAVHWSCRASMPRRSGEAPGSLPILWRWDGALS